SIIYVFTFNYPASPEIYTLSLHDALPIFAQSFDQSTSYDYRLQHLRIVSLVHGSLRNRHPEPSKPLGPVWTCRSQRLRTLGRHRDRKSTRLNSSHVSISYAVFCLKKKNVI